ncbi:MAG: methyltransferase domain-containing protein [Terracidiphilus sp.]
MSLKTLVVAHSPKLLIALAKHIRHRRRAGASRSLVCKLLKNLDPIKLELGSGSKRGVDGWTTLDRALGCDVYCDLAKGIPFPDRCVTAIYSSHVFEHLTYKEAQTLLDECLRVLVPGGHFSICVPNARLYLNAYSNNIEITDKRFFEYRPAYNFTTRMDYVNYVAYMDGQHKYMFDEENLVYILRQKGFKDARLRSFDKSLDREARDHESIYAEGYK